jgi:hypothetical protein
VCSFYKNGTQIYSLILVFVSYHFTPEIIFAGKIRGFTMSDHIKTKKSDLFINLSEKEQESISGGRSSSPFEMFYMFYQNTNIYSRASSDINISQGNLGISSRNEAEYQFSQTTFILSSLFGGGGGGGSRRNNRRRGRSLFAKLFSFF